MTIMMYYNLKKFGQTLKEIRSSQNITQKDVCEKVLINQETLRKIENGIVIPKQESLDLLSIALNVDLAKVFLTCRIDNYDAFEALKNTIDEHLESGAFDSLKEDLNNLQIIAEENMNQFFKNKITQLILMIEGLLIEVERQDYQISLDYYIKALSYTLANFSLTHYDTYHYNDLELRLLMNVALSLSQLGDHAVSLNLLEFCIAFCNKNSSLQSNDLLSKVYYNTSYIYHKTGSDQKALLYANLGIKHTISNRSIVALAHLYYRKGIAEYHLHDSAYIYTLNYAKNLFITSNHTHLHDKMVTSCKKYYGIML